MSFHILDQRRGGEKNHLGPRCLDRAVLPHRGGVCRKGDVNAGWHLRGYELAGVFRNNLFVLLFSSRKGKVVWIRLAQLFRCSQVLLLRPGIPPAGASNVSRKAFP